MIFEIQNIAKRITALAAGILILCALSGCEYDRTVPPYEYPRQVFVPEHCSNCTCVPGHWRAYYYYYH